MSQVATLAILVASIGRYDCSNYFLFVLKSFVWELTLRLTTLSVISSFDHILLPDGAVFERPCK